MTYSIGKTYQIGGLFLAVISETITTSFGRGRAIIFVGQKRPVFVLWRQDEEVTVVDMVGDPVLADKIAAICPTALEAFLKPK